MAVLTRTPIHFLASLKQVSHADMADTCTGTVQAAGGMAALHADAHPARDVPALVHALQEHRVRLHQRLWVSAEGRHPPAARQDRAAAVHARARRRCCSLSKTFAMGCATRMMPGRVSLWA